jgi:carbonic anhydrase
LIKKKPPAKTGGFFMHKTFLPFSSFFHRIRIMSNEIQTLIEGYEKFRELHFDQDDTFYADLVREGQRPKILMIACSDSRVDPALVMNCQPGDLFVVRNVANLVPPYEQDKSYHGTSAALEFGVCVLGIQHLILFGHTQCGGIQSLLDHSHEKCGAKSFLSKWMELAQPAHDRIVEYHENDPLEEKITLCGQYSLVNSLSNLKTFPWLMERIQKGTLTLHAWNFNMSNGIIEEYDEPSHSFRPIHRQ